MLNFEKGVPFLVHFTCEIFTYVQYYKTFIQKLEENVKNTPQLYRAYASTMLSVSHLHLLLLVPYFATHCAPFLRIHEQINRISISVCCYEVQMLSVTIICQVEPPPFRLFFNFCQIFFLTCITFGSPCIILYRAPHNQNYGLYQKTLQIKVVEH